MVFKKGNQLYKKRRRYKGKDNFFYGKHHSEESKNKQRVAWKKKYEEGYTNPWKGKHPTEETIQKMCEGILDKIDIYGDSYGVPTIVDIVEKLIEKINGQIVK